MSDLATLAIKIENGDVVKATTSLDSLTVAGGKSEAATQRLTRRMALLEIQAREMDAEMQRGGRAMAALETEARKMDAELAQSARAMALVEVEAHKMDAAITRAASDAARAMALMEIEAHKMDAAMSSNAASVDTLSATVQRMVAAFAAYKAAQFATETLNLAARYETLGVAMDVVGRNAGASAGRMAELQQDLQKTGISAVESRANLTRLTQAHIDLSQATKLARIAQDAAVIGNLNSSESFSTLIHGIQSAQTDVLRTIGINVNFENSYKRLAAQLHTTTDSLTEEQKMLARTNVVLEAGTRIAGAYEAAMGTVGKQVKSTERYLEDMRVKVGTAFLPEYAAAVKEYADALKTIGDNAPIAIGAILGITAAVSGLILLLKGSAIVTGIAAIGTAIAAIGASPIIVATAALVALGTVVGSFATDAALARREAAEFAETLKHLPDAALVRNIDQASLAIAEMNAEIAQSGGATKAQSERLAELTTKLKQYQDARTANAAAATAGDANAAAEAEAKRLAAAAAAAKEYKKVMEQLRDAVTDVARAELDASIARAKSIADAMAGTQQSLAESELLLAALGQGTDAYKAQQDEIEILHKLQAEGLTLSDAEYEAEKKRLEQIQRNTHAIEEQQKAQKDAEDAAKKAAEDVVRDNERRVRQMSKEASNIIAGALDDLGKKGANIAQSIWDTGKKSVNRLISDILGAKVGEKFGEMMGIGPGAAATKQVAAGAVMLQAAQLQVAAANAMMGAGVRNTAGGIVITDPGDPAKAGGAGSALATAGGYASIVAGAGLTGYNVGGGLTSTSHSQAGNNARGAVGGAVAGAVVGGTIGSVVPIIGTVVGAAVGAVVGAIGGLVGAGNAMKQSAKEAAMAVAAFNVSMDALTARNSGDELKAKIAQVNAERVQLAKAIEDAWSGGDANSDRVKWRTEKLKEMNAQEDAYIEQLTQEAALKSARRIEDYQARRDEATPGNEKEEALQATYRRLDREREDLILSFGSEIDATEAATLAMADQAFAAEKNKAATEAATTALNAFSTAVRYAPTGFKLDSYIQQFAKGSPFPAPPAAPGQWAPPQRPNFTASGAETATVATAPVTLNNPTFNFPNITDGATAAKAFLAELDKTKNATGGLNMTRAQALELMKAPMTPLRA